MGNVHVANGSSKFIRARVCQEKIRIKEIDVGGKISAGAPFSLEAKAKAELDHSLDEKMFAKIGPGESLEFDVESSAGEEFVTITTADDEIPVVICYNYNPPAGRSVIVTDHMTIQLSKRYGNMWKTADGRVYGGPDMIKPGDGPKPKPASSGCCCTS